MVEMDFGNLSRDEEQVLLCWWTNEGGLVKTAKECHTTVQKVKEVLERVAKLYPDFMAKQKELLHEWNLDFQGIPIPSNFRINNTVQIDDEMYLDTEDYK